VRKEKGKGQDRSRGGVVKRQHPPLMKYDYMLIRFCDNRNEDEINSWKKIGKIMK
jgi:hypothetical protein